MRNDVSRPDRTSTFRLVTVSLLALSWVACGGPGSVPTGLDGTGGASSIGASHGTAGSSGVAGRDSMGRAGTSGAAGSNGTAGGGGAGETTGAGESTGGGGSAGTTGKAGTTGASGTVGTSGSAGTSGKAGTTGSAGTTGAAATTGAGGTTGRAGATGAAGTTGKAGTSGAAGSSGTSGSAGTGGSAAGTGGTSTAGSAIEHVFVIAMENEPAASIYGNKKTPYLNGLAAKYARATAFTDPLPDSIPSEPHYVWMEAGTNKFSDVTFTDDSDPSSGNSTKSTDHLVTQMMSASPPVSWMGLMEGLDSGTGACPVSSSGFYAAKHDPFVFFQDIAGKSPSASNALCSAHHKAFTSGQAAVQGTVAQYTFISPNVCNDMHGDPECPSSASDVIATGDAWLAANLPPLVDYATAHGGVIFIVWDEPEGGSNLIPFFAIGPQVKPGYTSTTAYTHSSLLKTVEEIFSLPVLPTVAGANDFADLFQPGTLR